MKVDKDVTLALIALATEVVAAVKEIILAEINKG